MSSSALAGTSLALGMPLISTKEQRKYSMPCCFTSALRSSVNSVPPWINLLRHRSGSFFPDQLAGGKSDGRKRLHQRRRLASGDRFREAVAGNRTGLEAPGAPTHIHKE